MTNLPLVFLPGMMCDDRLYAPQIEALSPDYDVQVLPVTGHDNMNDLAAEVLLQAPQRFVLAGLSMGGIVAMEVVRQAPDRIERLILMDTNPKSEADAVKAMRQPQIDAVQSGGLEAVLTQQMIPNYLHSTSTREDLKELCLQAALDLGPDVFTRQSLALRDRPDQQETLKTYQGQTLILTGDDDRLCPMHRHTLMHELLPNSELVVIEGAGHLPTLEKPEETNAALQGWLRQG